MQVVCSTPRRSKPDTEQMTAMLPSVVMVLCFSSVQSKRHACMHTFSHTPKHTYAHITYSQVHHVASRWTVCKYRVKSSYKNNAKSMRYKKPLYMAQTRLKSLLLRQTVLDETVTTVKCECISVCHLLYTKALVFAYWWHMHLWRLQLTVTYDGIGL